MRLLIFIALIFTCVQSQAKPIESTIGHVYFGVGPNFNMRGNIRIGFSSVELGLVQGAGIGLMYVHRTATPFFYQVGALFSDGGGVIGGGGMEWDTFSFFRFRTDVTVKTNVSFETEGYVSIGGVFIL